MGEFQLLLSKIYSEKDKELLFESIIEELYDLSDFPLKKCSICGSIFKIFLPYAGNKNVACPNCGSLPNHRLLFNYLYTYINNVDKLNFFDLSGEFDSLTSFNCFKNINYVSLNDLKLNNFDNDLNFLAKLNENTFDIIYESKILSNYFNSLEVLENLFRIIKPVSNGGVLIINDSNVNSLNFDLKEVLLSIGFNVEIYPPNDVKSEGINENDYLYVCTKDSVAKECGEQVMFDLEDIYGNQISSINIVKEFEEYSDKPVCVFGVLLTEEGKLIREEMLEWLKPLYDVYVVEQDSPGELFEYPAIRFMQYICHKDNLDFCLYLHSKGAARPHDGQKSARLFWRYEFTNFKGEYIKNVNVDSPTVACPFTGKSKTTWCNGFFVNSLALDALKLPDSPVSRFYYETMFKDVPEVNVIGRVYNDVDDDPHEGEIIDGIEIHAESKKRAGRYIEECSKLV